MGFLDFLLLHLNLVYGINYMHGNDFKKLNDIQLFWQLLNDVVILVMIHESENADFALKNGKFILNQTRENLEMKYALRKDRIGIYQQLVRYEMYRLGYMSTKLYHHTEIQDVLLAVGWLMAKFKVLFFAELNSNDLLSSWKSKVKGSAIDETIAKHRTLNTVGIRKTNDLCNALCRHFRKIVSICKNWLV